MNLTKLFEMQRTLDERIVKEKGLEGKDLLPNTVLALQVELAEMINEWRGFKHWSKDQEPRRAKMLTEAADCLHFFLSIGRQLGLNADDYRTYDDFINGDTSNVMSELIYYVSLINVTKLHDNKVTSLKNAWFIFLNTLEQRLQIYDDDLFQAYIDKNEINHERQSTGY